MAGDNVPPPPVERAPGGSVLQGRTPQGMQHRSTEHGAGGGDATTRGTGGGEGDIGIGSRGRRTVGGGGLREHGVPALVGEVRAEARRSDRASDPEGAEGLRSRLGAGV